MYHRTIFQDVIEHCFQKKAIIIYGARQVGKTTLCKAIIDQYATKKILSLNGDDTTVQQLLVPSLQRLTEISKGYDILFIDEAQRIRDIGLIIKILVDTFPLLQVIATGSSSFDLANKVSEAMTGRAYIYHLYPISYQEIYGSQQSSLLLTESIQQQLLFGSYPEQLAYSHQEKKEYLSMMVNHYLYKDILLMDGIKKSSVLISILQALALQIGSETSYLEIATTVGVSKDTVIKYIDIMEQAFIIKGVSSLHTNQRREIKSHKKYYFRDLGIRNAVIQNFAPLHLRSDIGGLWENYCIIEKLKYNQYHKKNYQHYFRRQTAGSEIDFIEKQNDMLTCYECKYHTKKFPPIPAAFTALYKNNVFHILNPHTIGTYIS